MCMCNKARGKERKIVLKSDSISIYHKVNNIVVNEI